MQSAKTRVYGTLALLAVVSTAVPVMLFWTGVDMIGASKTSIIATVEPLTTVALAMVVFREMLTPFQVLGATLIIMGVVIVQLPDKQSARPVGAAAGQDRERTDGEKPADSENRLMQARSGSGQEKGIARIIGEGNEGAGP